MKYEHLLVREKDHKQDIIIILKNGEQICGKLKCYIEKNPKGPDNVLFHRTINVHGKNCRLIKYNEKQNLLIYKLVN